MSMRGSSELERAIQERIDEIDRIAAEKVRGGMDPMEAIERAERDYRRSKGQKVIEPMTVDGWCR